MHPANPRCFVCKASMSVCSGDVTENVTANAIAYKCCSGLCIDLLNMLSEKIDLEFDLFEVPDRKFGSYEKVGPKVSVLSLFFWL